MKQNTEIFDLNQTHHTGNKGSSNLPDVRNVFLIEKWTERDHDALISLQETKENIQETYKLI